MAWKAGGRRRNDGIADDYGAAEALVVRDGHKFPMPQGAAARRYDGDRWPWLAVVNARGPWGTWRHLEANPPYIPLCLSLWEKSWWLEAPADQRLFCLEIWRLAAMEDWWGIFWGDPSSLRRKLGQDGATFARRLDWMIERGLLAYLSDDERSAARSIRADGDGEERGKGGDKEGGRERAEQRQSKTEQGALPPKAAEAEDKARQEQSGSAKPEHRPEAQAQQRQGDSTGPQAPRVIGNVRPPCGVRLDPPETDGGGRGVSGACSRTIGAPARRGGATSLGQSLPQSLRMAADPVKYGFLGELYGRLAFPYAMDSPLGRQELGAFESLYEDLKRSGLPAAAQMEILAKGLEEADKIARKKRNRKKGAVWCHVHKQRVQTYLARAGPKR